MRIFNKLKSLSKKTKFAAVSLIALVAIGVPAAVFAGYGPNGPDRVIYDFQNPAQREGAFDAPRFNSYINTDVYGDERAFLDAKECVVSGPQCYSQGQAGGYKDQQPVTPGKEYIVRAYVHNIANPSINASGLGVAKNTRFKVQIPGGVANGFTVNATISADNSIPRAVYDTVDLRNESQRYSVEYVPGSAYISNAAHPGGLQLGDDIVGANGTQIGSENVNGDYLGCFEHSSFITIRVKVVAPNLQVTKRVTTPGSTDWRENINVNAGDTVSWLINYDISGATANDVTIRDTIPAGVTLVPGSITWFDPNRPEGNVQPDTVLNAGGVNVGNYQAGSGGAIRFRTTVNPINPTDPTCQITNRAFGRAQNIPEISDDASITINNCRPTQPVFTCDLLTVAKINDRNYRYSVNYTARNGAVLRSYTYNFGDNTTPLTTDRNPVEHVYAQDGRYATRVTLTFDVNGQQRTATSDACAKTIEVTPRPHCPIPGKEHLPPDSPECKNPPTENCPIPGKETLPKNSKECVIVDTGAGSVIGIFTGVSAAGAVAHRVFAGRRRQD